MSNRYKHPKHGVVDVLRRFDFYWSARSGDGSIVQVRPGDCHPIADPIQLHPTPNPAQPQPQSDQFVEESIDSPADLVEINKLYANQIANALPYIGKLKAKQILSAKPDGGFADFNELKSLLPEDFLSEEQWAEIEPLISYAS
jgi:hypothetical protein